MSRIWKMPVAILEKASATVKGENIVVKGPLWELSFDFSSKIKVTVNENEVVVTKNDDGANALWGTTRSIIDNMMVGVTAGYSKSLEIVWVWYKFEVQGKKLVLSIGFSHKVDMEISEGLKVELEWKKNEILKVSGIDKQLVWEFASKVRSKKKPEPYKGKGIKYVWEKVGRKAGKTGAAK